MKDFIVGTNWKMNKTFSESEKYINDLLELVKAHSQYTYFVIPPYTHLKTVRDQLRNSNVLLGAQNMHWEQEGSYTGEISPLWLSEIGVNIAELGHSERRQFYNENDEDLNKKVHAALKYHMTPLLCIGEYAKDKYYKITKEVLCRQIKIALSGVDSKQTKSIWIAYEPVWAIGEKGIPAEPKYVEEVHSYIRDQLKDLFGENGDHIPILYGGSVNVENCVPIAQRKNVNGLFIGRSAWNIDSFKKIIELLEQAKMEVHKE
ncbi:MAG: triose-phosphate isomerase [Bacillota bacterium]|nr:triose-phosphate isomerase [Bacillota bacterium]